MAKAVSHVDGFIKRILSEQGKLSDAASRARARREAKRAPSFSEAPSQSHVHVIHSGEIQNASLESQLLKLYSDAHRSKEEDEKE